MLIRNALRYRASAAVLAYAAQGVQIHPDVGAKYAAGTIPDAFRIVIFKTWYAGPGSRANPLYPNSRGSNNHIIFGSMDNINNAESVPGVNELIDNSAPNNSLYRMNAAALATQTVNMAYGPNAATPGVPSNLWVADLNIINVAQPSGSKIGSLNRNGVELSHAITQTGVWDAVTPIKLSTSDFWINAVPPGDGGIAPGEFWAAQMAMWALTQVQWDLIANADGTLKADAWARFFNVGVGPKDLGADGSGPGIGTPFILHELRAGQAVDQFWKNKGNLGVDPTVLGSANANIKRVFRAPLDPFPTIDRPYRAGFPIIDNTALNDAVSGGGTYAGLTNYGQRIKGVGASKTLIRIWVNMGYDAGGLRNVSIADQHAVAYTKNIQVNGTFGESYVFTKVADANDETAQFTDWTNFPTLTWTPRGGFVDGKPSITVEFIEGPTTPMVRDTQGNFKAAATAVTGFVCDACTAVANKGLLTCAIGTLGWNNEPAAVSPPASMGLVVAVGTSTRLTGGPMFMAEEAISASGSTGTRTFAASVGGGNQYREISQLLENS